MTPQQMHEERVIGRYMRGKTLEQIQKMAIRASYERHAGELAAISTELGARPDYLLDWLDDLGLIVAEEPTEEEEATPPCLAPGDNYADTTPAPAPSLVECITNPIRE